MCIKNSFYFLFHCPDFFSVYSMTGCVVVYPRSDDPSVRLRYKLWMDTYYTESKDTLCSFWKWVRKNIPMANHHAPLIRSTFQHELMFNDDGTFVLERKCDFEEPLVPTRKSVVCILTSMNRMVVYDMDQAIGIMTRAGRDPYESIKWKCTSSMFRTMLIHDGHSAFIDDIHTTLLTKNVVDCVKKLLGFRHAGFMLCVNMPIPNTQTKRSIIHYVAISGYVQVMRLCMYLCKNRYSYLDLPTESGDTPLILAAMICHVDMVEYLLQCGVNVHACNEHGRSALLWAVLKDNEKTAKLLLENGANANEVYGKNRMSVLMYACACRHTKIITLLLNHGASIHHCAHDGSSPVSVSSDPKHTEVAEILRDHENRNSVVYRIQKFITKPYKMISKYIS